MLDIKFIRDNPDKVKEGLKKKGVDFDLDHLLAVDEKRRAKIKEVDDLRSEQNAASDEIAKLAGEERAQKIAAAQGLKTGLSDSELELKALEEEFNQLINQIPNLPDDDVPVGRDESANQVVRRWGNVPQFSFEPKDHVALGEALDVIDTERASRVAGARFSYFKGEAALLEFALVQFTFGALISPEFLGKVADAVEDGYPAKPFTPVVPPVMINPEVFTKMARLNEQDKDERYYLPKDNLYLVGSAEHTLGPLHMGEIVDEDKLP
ncbi:MAG: serine--tRNA ligase, partial [Candidatus Sungbacteria bacterium]|nr:serine--tRNA ligase [Candidatus Sungbacteria bacterium]